MKRSKHFYISTRLNKIKKVKFILTIIIFTFYQSIKGQLKVAITIDDVPNKTFFINSTKSAILHSLDSLNIPICIFINEGKTHNNDSLAKNELLNNWISKKYITLGNHSYSHFRYSDVTFETFTNDILKGEVITKKTAKKYHKKLKYFRFPFNDLGKDSTQQALISNFLISNNYQITPFTIESVDWMYNYVYEYYLSKNEIEKAKEIGESYVTKTLEYFNYIENITTSKYGKSISQIYMCHDNILNANYLPILVKHLKQKKYSLIRLKTALKDDVYKQQNYYTNKWGISWVYRWVKDKEERKLLIKNEPSTEDIETLFQKIEDSQKLK